MASSKEQEVAKAVENLHAGLVNADRKLLESVTAEGLTYGHSTGNTESKSEVVEAFVSGKYKFGKITVTDQTIQLFGETVATVRHKLHATTADKGKEPGEVNLIVLTVWLNTAGTWQLITRQAVRK